MFHGKLLGPIKTEELIARGKRGKGKGQKGNERVLVLTFTHYLFPFALSFWLPVFL
jgi:hypothetical protein